jgi:hypothetical protein
MSDVGNKEKHKEEESRRKVGKTISLNIGALESSRNVKISVQCSDKEEMSWPSYLVDFKMFLLGLIRIFMVLILVLYIMLSPSRRA